MRHLSTDLRRRDRHYHHHHHHHHHHNTQRHQQHRHTLNNNQIENVYETNEEMSINYLPNQGQQQQRRFRHPHLPPLFYSVQNRNWEEVIRRSTTHSHEILTYEDMSGNTPLHVACRLDPPANVIQCLLIAKNEVNKEGATPLHIASSSRCSKEVILVLIGAAEGDDDSGEDYENRTLASAGDGGGVMALTKMGRAPIHYACMSFRGLGVDAFQVLLEATIRAGEGYGEDDEDEKEEQEDSEEDKKMPAKQTSHKKSKWNDCSKKKQKGKKKRGGILCRWKTLNNGKMQDEDEGYETDDNITSDEEDSFYATDKEEHLYEDENQSQASSIDNNNSIYEGNPVTLRDVTGQTPLGLLFRRYRERVRYVIKRVESSYLRGNNNGHSNTNNSGDGNDNDNDNVNSDGNSTAAAQAVQADLGELWEKSRLIVGAMAEQQQQQRLKLRRNGTKLCSSYVSVEEEEEEDFVALEAAAWAARRFRRRASCDYQNYNDNESHDAVADTNYYQGGAIAEEETTALENHNNDGNQNDFFYHNLDNKNNSNSSDNEDEGESKEQEQNKNRQEEFRIVHASVGLTGYGCPPEMIRLALSVHPEQAREMDEDGNLPLHIAAVARSASTTDGGDGEDDDDGVCDDNNNSGYASKFGLEVLREDATTTTTSLGTTLLAATTNTTSTIASSSDDVSLTSEASSLFQPYTSSTKSFDKVIKILLRHYPESARIPHGRTGRLPLMMAIDSGRRTWDDGIKALLENYPAALESRVLDPKLYPCILSLIGGTGNNTSHYCIATANGEGAEMVDALESTTGNPNSSGQKRWWGVRVLRRGNSVCSGGGGGGSGGNGNNNRRRRNGGSSTRVGVGRKGIVDGKLDPLFDLLKAIPHVVSDAI